MNAIHLITLQESGVLNSLDCVSEKLAAVDIFLLLYMHSCVLVFQGYTTNPLKLRDSSI